MQGSDPGYTKYLYAGEQYDANLGMTYLRGRYYDSANGTFNRMDPFRGHNRDPQSLHKYAYCYANPVNNTDPSGLWGMISTLFVVFNISLLATYLGVSYFLGRSQKQRIDENSELYNRVVNPRGIWYGPIGSLNISLGVVKLLSHTGHIYAYNNHEINAAIEVFGLATGIGAGVSGGGGIILVYNARSLKQVSEIESLALDLHIDLLDPLSETALVKLGLKAKDIADLVRYIETGKDLFKLASSAEKLKEALAIGNGKPTAIIFTYQYGLQLYVGASVSDLYVGEPSFQ